MADLPLKIIQNSQKQMPCNIEAEQALIGSILVSNDIYDEITLIVNAQKFFDPIHAKIFDTIEMLISKGLLANPITLKNYFENNEGLKELGGQEYLIKITKFSTSVKQAIDYANIVHEMHLRRELIKISESVLSEASDNSEVTTSGEEMIQKTEKSLKEKSSSTAKENSTKDKPPGSEKSTTSEKKESTSTKTAKTLSKERAAWIFTAVSLKSNPAHAIVFPANFNFSLERCADWFEA